ncbi:hypothetical protein LJC05_04335, partial [Bacteroides sp. OttesenSCG-928-J23]|nr:hypothetical protein [Bacteroides sp. OttesenSCG-928-J23]
PYTDDVQFETVAAMAYVMGRLQTEVSIPYGNDVIGDDMASIPLAAAVGAKFGRGVYHGCFSTSSGWVDSHGGQVARRKHNLRMDHFKQVHYLIPESSADPGGRDPIDIMKPIYFLNRPDAIGVAGPVAGQKFDAQLLARCRENFSDAVLFAVTGVKVDNVHEIMPIADGAFIGTHFKVDGVFRNGIDKNRVKTFMDRVKSLRDR